MRRPPKPIFSLPRDATKSNTALRKLLGHTGLEMFRIMISLLSDPNYGSTKEGIKSISVSVNEWHNRLAKIGIIVSSKTVKRINVKLRTNNFAIVHPTQAGGTNRYILVPDAIQAFIDSHRVTNKVTNNLPTQGQECHYPGTRMSPLYSNSTFLEKENIKEIRGPRTEEEYQELLALIASRKFNNDDIDNTDDNCRIDVPHESGEKNEVAR